MEGCSPQPNPCPEPVFTPHEKIPQRPRSSPEKSPLRHRHVLAVGGVGLHRHLVMNNKNPRPHRLVFDCTHLMDDTTTMDGVGRPAGASPDKENEGERTKITAEKLPALGSRYLAPQPPSEPSLAVQGFRVKHYAHIVMQPPAGEGETAQHRRVNWKHEKIAPMSPRTSHVDLSLPSPVLRRHCMELSPLRQKYAGTPKPSAAVPFADSPLTPECELRRGFAALLACCGSWCCICCAAGLTPRPLEEEEHANLKLFAEARSGNVAAVRTALRSLQLMPSARDEFGNTILIIAVENNDRTMVKLALKYGVDVNWVNFAGNSALHVAAADGKLAHEWIFQLSLDRSLNLVGFRWLLTVPGNRKLVRRLLRHGGDPLVVNEAGLTCFDLCPGAFSPGRSSSR
jgi:hypothetical protein